MKKSVIISKTDRYDIENISYLSPLFLSRKKSKKSIEVIGLDTEAYRNGKCFMICTSLGDIYTIKDFPDFLFTRKYRNKKFVTYNLKYDEGSFVQILNRQQLDTLRITGETRYKAYKIKIISGKYFSVSRGKNAIQIYDMYNFYYGTLNYNAKTYLGMKKKECNVKHFTKQYVNDKWDKIAAYCIHDCVLVQKLAVLIIKKFEQLGVYPRRLYSKAYIAFQYFRENTRYVTVRRFWDNDKSLLDYALKSYHGGKFEVTEKCYSYLYEYDIVSAYPAIMSELLCLYDSRILWYSKYRKDADYGFIKCVIKIGSNVFSPIPVKWYDRNVYPVGEVHATITKIEYEYLIEHNCDIHIEKAVWIYCEKKIYPYRKIIQHLVRLKTLYKKTGKLLDLEVTKKMLNSIYGKNIQLVWKKKKWHASSCWNPIYASLITAGVRIRVTELQNRFSSIIAVHTDSIIAKKKLDIEKQGMLGDFILEIEGQGVVAGCGIYQVGKKSKFRGFRSDIPIIKLLDCDKNKLKIPSITKLSWKQISFFNWSLDEINYFKPVIKSLHVNFDQKRLWIDDYKIFNEIFQRNVLSEPRKSTSIGIL